MNRREFFKLVIGSAACVSLFRPRLWRFPEDATVDEINEFLFFRGLRPCPHSHHSTDEEFAECTARPRNPFEKRFNEYNTNPDCWQEFDLRRKR